MQSRIILIEELADIFRYSEGEIYFRVGKPGRHLNRPAGHITHQGYRKVCINYQKYRVHAIVWALHHGEWVDNIDHIDQNPLNNRIENLRLATRSQNNMNRRCGNNTSGFRGVSFHTKENRWRATIKVNKKAIHLGYFHTQEEAAKCFDSAVVKYHGEFAKFSKDLV